MLSLPSFRAIFPALVLAAIAWCTTSGRADGDQGAATPVPPQQDQKWVPPATDLPPLVVKAIGELFRDGLPDPRGCEYREVEVTVAKTQTFKTHGWVLTGSEAQKYAIAWNGMIYPVISVGSPADLQKEIAAIPPEQRRFRGFGVGWPMSDRLSSNVTFGALPLHVAFLLRLGEGKLAGEMWRDGSAQKGALPTPDPYIDMAGTWMDRAYNRAAQAFLDHDDSYALTICRQLSPIVANLKAVASSKGNEDPWPVTMYGNQLWQLPTLEADLDRRATEKPSTPVVESGHPAQGPERIAALIHDLDQSFASQFSNPGDTDITDDPTVQALIKEGHPAVEPLLKCLVEDNRLTRARYTRGMSFGGPIIPVYEAAYKALFRILNVSFPLYDDDSQDYRQQKDPRAMSLKDRTALAAKLDAVWEKAKSRGLAKSAYLALQDDNASPKEWFRAIDDILQPADGSRTRYALTPAQSAYRMALDDGFKARGEALRIQTDPSVSDLLIKRFEQLVQRKAGDDFDLTELGNILLGLAAWDGKAHLADLKRMGGELDARFIHDLGSSSAVVNVSLCEKRLQLGDETALADYAAYLRHLSPDDLKKYYQQGHGTDFNILGHYPDDPGIRQTAEALFSGKDAPLAPIPNSLVATPLLGVPAFRNEVLRGLDDKSPAGTVTVRQGVVDYLFTATHSSSGESPGFSPLESNPPKPGDVVNFRLCDNYAYILARIAGFPDCKLYWPETKRDAAVAACKALILQYGDALRGQPSDPYDDQTFAYFPCTATLRIKPPDHPATPEDVKAGHALFSLSGQVRVWKMPSYPLGAAWQAEEVFKNEKWERYFGTFRNGIPTKVPAREMDFVGYLVGSVPITKEIDAALSGPDDVDRTEVNMSFARLRFVAVSAPVPITIDVRNHNGEEQAVPRELMLPHGAKKMLPAGLALTVSYSAKVPPLILRLGASPFDFGTFSPLPLRQGISVSPPSAQTTMLYPSQKLSVFQADLGDYFDLGRPGTYHVKATFNLPGHPPASTYELTFYLSSNEIGAR